tara:strand:+ start:486 stop:887 length:402 start_codon:yes stop_codon:yes gene_type:complete
MKISEVSYLGNLRTACKHLKSGDTIITDAPTDNNGKGEAFSPTDLVATSLASCAMTIIGIYCENNNIRFEQCEANVEKIMGTQPRKVDRIVVEFSIGENKWDSETLKRIEQVAASCPVDITLKNSVEIEYKFI